MSYRIAAHAIFTIKTRILRYKTPPDNDLHINPGFKPAMQNACRGYKKNTPADFEKSVGVSCKTPKNNADCRI